jgi:hypothetical protein
MISKSVQKLRRLLETDLHFKGGTYKIMSSKPEGTWTIQFTGTFDFDKLLSDLNRRVDPVDSPFEKRGEEAVEFDGDDSDKTVILIKSKPTKGADLRCDDWNEWLSWFMDDIKKVMHDYALRPE